MKEKNSEERSNNTKQMIMDECVREFNEIGAGFTLDDIVKALKISKKTIYKYFLGKNDIFCTIIDDIQQGIYLDQLKIKEDDSLPIEEKLRKLLTVKAKYEDSVRLDRMPELAKEEPEMFAYLMKAYETQWTIVEEVLSQGISEGIYKDFNVTLIRMLLQNGMQMLYTNQFLIKSQMRYETALKEVVEIVLDGIRKK